MRSQRSQTAILLFLVLLLILAILGVYLYFLRPASGTLPAKDPAQSALPGLPPAK